MEPHSRFLLLHIFPLSPLFFGCFPSHRRSLVSAISPSTDESNLATDGNIFRSPLVLFLLTSHFCPLPVAFQSSLILLHWLNSLGSPERPPMKRVRLAEPPHILIKTQAVPPEIQCISPFNCPVHVLRQIHPHGFIVKDSRLKWLRRSRLSTT